MLSGPWEVASVVAHFIGSTGAALYVQPGFPGRSAAALSAARPAGNFDHTAGATLVAPARPAPGRDSSSFRKSWFIAVSGAVESHRHRSNVCRSRPSTDACQLAGETAVAITRLRNARSPDNRQTGTPLILSQLPPTIRSPSPCLRTQPPACGPLNAPRPSDSTPHVPVVLELVAPSPANLAPFGQPIQLRAVRSSVRPPDAGQHLRPHG